MNKEEYDRHMDELALRIGKVLDGEDKWDAASACAACAVYGVVTSPGTARDRAVQLETIIQFMRDTFLLCETEGGVQ